MPISWRMDKQIVVVFHRVEFDLAAKRYKRKVAELTTVPTIPENNHQGGAMNIS